MISNIILYMLAGIVIGIFTIILTHVSIKRITCDVFGRPIGNRYRDLCLTIFLSSLFVWPIYLFVIVVPRLLFKD